MPPTPTKAHEASLQKEGGGEGSILGPKVIQAQAGRLVCLTPPLSRSLIGLGLVVCVTIPPPCMQHNTYRNLLLNMLSLIILALTYTIN